MTQREKDLLIKDLCSRLPYGVKCSFGVDDSIYEICGINPVNCGASEIQATHIKSGINGDFVINSCKPYLFPLSSMTEEQQIIYGDLCYQIIRATPFEIQNCFNELYNWLIKNNFDYQGLIPKGLAIDATGLNIY